MRPLMGVCPQFDVLWEHLTGEEHLLLFAAIKGGWGGVALAGVLSLQGWLYGSGWDRCAPNQLWKTCLPAKKRIAPALTLPRLQACRPASGGVTLPGCWRM